MKNIKNFCILAFLAVFFSSCGFMFGNDEYYDAKMNSEKRGREIAEHFISCVNKKDKAELKSMFSQSIKNKFQDLDAKITELFEALPDGIHQYEISPFVGGTGSFASWEVIYNKETVRIFIPEIKANTGDEDIYIAINYTHINHEKPDEVGINEIEFIDRTDRAHEKKITIGSYEA